MKTAIPLEYRVPYADTDQMRVVYYANYLRYFEMAREEMLRKIGYPYTRLESEGFALPVCEAYCRYKKSARFEDVLTITSRVAEIQGVRCRIECAITRQDGDVIAEGYTIHAFLKDGRPVRPPRSLVDAIESV